MVAQGWTAEFAIPFAILKYGKGQSVFGLDLVRYIAREDEETSWPPMPGDAWDAVYTADWVDLQTPHVKRKPVVMGYGTAEAAEEGSGVHVGLDVKQFYEPDTTLVATVNPDFENIEDEVESIVFSYGERYVADRRTFFLEGQRYLPQSHIFYSRRVPAFDAGLKAYGRVRDWEFGMLDAWRMGDRNDLVICGRYRPDQFNTYEASLAAAHWEGTDGHTGGLWHRYSRSIRQGDLFSSALVAKSWNAGPGGEGLYQSHQLAFWPNPGYLGGSLVYASVPNEYIPIDGFVGERGFQGMWVYVEYGEKVEQQRLQLWECRVSGSRYMAQGGGLHHGSVNVGGEVATRGGGRLGVGYYLQRRPPNLDRTWSLGLGWKQNLPLQSGGLRVEAGKIMGGRYFYSSLAQGLHPGEAWAFRACSEYQRLALPGLLVDDVFQGILSANFDLDPEHTLAGRYVNTGGEHNFYVTYRQVVRRGLDAYVILGNPNVEKTQGRLAFKVVSVF